MNETIYWFMTALKKYSDFEGRARRKEYWSFILVYLLTMTLFIFIDIMTGTMTILLGLSLGFLSGLYLLFISYPLIAVTTRRLHDTGRTGWWQISLTVPSISFFAISSIIMLYFTIQDSQPGDNEYGSNPKLEKN